MFTLSRARFVCISIAILCVSNVRTLAGETTLEVATFGGGCYWCTEAVFQRIKGVESVSPGFMGGRTKNPTYSQVMTGRTGHAEVIHIRFDQNAVAYETLLQVFFRTHDPTTRNRQGPDTGTQYRSVVFCHTREQRATASEYKRLLGRQKAFRSPIVTQIEDAGAFYPTDETEHLNYFNQNKGKAYCVANIVPKLQKLRDEFGDHLKEEDAK